MRYKLRKRFNFRINGKLRYILLLALFALCIMIGIIIYNRAIPASTAESLKNEAISMINEQVNSCVDNYLSKNPDFKEKCITAKTDHDGNIISYTTSADMLEKAEIEILKNLRNALGKNTTVKISVPIGSLTGNKFFEGLGLPVSVRAHIVPAVKTEIKTAIESAGINQSLYKVLLNFDITCQIMRHGDSENFTYSAECNLIQMIIIGDVPLTNVN